MSKLLTSFKTSTSFLDGASLLITGGTGSFGNALVQTLLDEANLRRIIIYSRDELKQYEMHNRLANHPKFHTIRFFIGDVRDKSRLQMALRDIDYVVHAAALKQVPAAEYNPFECIRTNIIGAENVVEACMSRNVKKVVALSTDKAANPLNLYGATKLASDKIFVATNNLSGKDGTRFSVVRYGNVIGSRGSVIPFFKQLLTQNTDHLPITHDQMTRFWITLQQGVDFVLTSLSRMDGGEIYIPKIPSTTITDIAKAMAPNIPIKIIGIRPGEKLHEIMVPMDEARQTVEMDNCYIIQPSYAFWRLGENKLADAKEVSPDFEYTSNNNPHFLDIEEIKQLLRLLYPNEPF